MLKLPDNTDPLNFSLTNICDQPKTTTDTNDLRKKYPDVRFWSQADYFAFVSSPEAQGVNRGKLPYLENVDGTAVSPDNITVIRATLHTIWAELLQRQMAPRTWTKITASAKALVYNFMVKKHPIFGLDTDGFKLESLCILDYSGWRKNRRYTPPDGSSSKTEPKEEDLSDLISPLATKSRKRKNGTGELAQKRHKGTSLIATKLLSVTNVYNPRNRATS